jgi:23S rRNA (uracil1939-C5)-methyltransferase
MRKSVEVFVESMAFKGYGVARVEGKVLFIPFSAPSDKVMVEIVDEKKDYSIGEITHLITPSPWRADPQCPYFYRCGGCQWQHIDAIKQAELKGEILKDVLKRLGKLNQIPPIALSPFSHPYGYRVRVQLKIEGKTLGFFRERSHRIVDIDHCPISHPLINRIIPSLRKEMPSLTKAEAVEINISPEEEKAVLIFHSRLSQPELRHFAEKLLKNRPDIKGIALEERGSFISIGDPYLVFTVPTNRNGKRKDLSIRTSPGSFFQVNPEQNQRLIETVLKFAAVKEGETGLDLYAGIGNLTLPLSLGVKEITGIEENKKTVEDARFNAGGNNIKNCLFLQGRAEEALEQWNKKNPDFIVLDPPRAGCRDVLDQLIRLRPERIVYVSCDPATFSRDLRLFSEKGYGLTEIALIDMFPQTYHMETVGLLKSLY